MPDLISIYFYDLKLSAHLGQARGLHAPADPGGSDVAGLILGRALSKKMAVATGNAPVSTGYGYQVMLFRASCSDPGILPRQAEPGNDELAGFLGETKSFFF